MSCHSSTCVLHSSIIHSLNSSPRGSTIRIHQRNCKITFGTVSFSNDTRIPRTFIVTGSSDNKATAAWLPRAAKQDYDSVVRDPRGQPSCRTCRRDSVVISRACSPESSAWCLSVGSQSPRLWRFQPLQCSTRQRSNTHTAPWFRCSSSIGGRTAKRRPRELCGGVSIPRGEHTA